MEYDLTVKQARMLLLRKQGLLGDYRFEMRQDCRTVEWEGL
ncbi:hypothetical protein [Lachnotalea sp. AF33-28]|jgi:hypothetical protein|nr:hypothetical protein [Lachnotalea sp. AF33-28]